MNRAIGATKANNLLRLIISEISIPNTLEAAPFSMIPDTNGKSESQSPDADELSKLLQIELAQKKMEWAAATERYRRIRTLSFFFLALIIMGALAAFFWLFLRLPTDHLNRTAPAASASP